MKKSLNTQKTTANCNENSFFYSIFRRQLVLKFISFFVVMLTGVGLKAGDHDTLWTKRIGTVSAVKFSPDGSKVAAGTETGEYYIYNTQTGEELRHYSHKGNGCFDFTYDSKYLCTGGGYSSDSSFDYIKLWDLDSTNSFQAIKDTIKASDINFKAITDIVFSWDNRCFAVSYYLGAGNTSLVIYDRSQNIIFKEFKSKNEASYQHLHFSKDNKYLAASFYLNNNSDKVIIYDVKTWQIIKSYDHPRTIFDVKFSPGGKKLITGCDDGYVRIWDMETFKLDTQYNIEAVYSVDFSKDSKYYFACSGSVLKGYFRKYEITNNKVNYDYDVYDPEYDRYLFFKLDISLDGKYIAGGCRKGLYIFKADLLSSLDGSNSAIEATLYPNPATNNLSIKIELPNNEIYKINITDINGNEIKLIQNEFFDAGEKTFEIDCSSLSAGTYFIKVSSTTFIKTYKLMKVQ